MKMFSIIVLTASMCVGQAAFAANSPDCGKGGMTCAPPAKNLSYTSGVKSPECGSYGMTCAPMPVAAAAAAKQGARMTSGRSMMRMHHRRHMRHHHMRHHHMG